MNGLTYNIPRPMVVWPQFSTLACAALLFVGTSYTLLCLPMEAQFKEGITWESFESSLENNLGKKFLQANAVTLFVHEGELAYIPAGYITYMCAFEGDLPKAANPKIFSALHIPLGGAFSDTMTAPVKAAVRGHNEALFGTKPPGSQWADRKSFFDCALCD